MNLNLSQIRTKGDLINWLKQGHRVEYLFFWGHTPKAPEIIDKSCFSQWFPASFKIDDVHYPTAEHFMMAEKARLFGDSEAEQKILNCGDPHHAKKLGRLVKNYDDKKWLEHRFDIVVRGNLGKFRQNPLLQEFLENSETRVIVEASPRDRIWGIGMGAAHPSSENPSQWRGENLLGFGLMEVREQLRL